MSNTNTEVLTTAYENLQKAITQANKVLPNLESAIESGNLQNYATTSQLEDIENITTKINMVSEDGTKWVLYIDNYGQIGVIKESE